jgi:eukaryotic-like serine/threonine-protein kinase
VSDWIGDYEILGELGRGGMGIVYRARRRDTAECVALKVMKGTDPDALARFRRECRILQDLHHPNVVVLYDVECDQGRWFFTMQLVEGRPFLEHIQFAAGGDPTQEIPLPPQEQAEGGTVPSPVAPDPAQTDRLRDLFGQLAGGILALHERDVLHRDLKPSNVMVTREGTVMVLDFGLATGGPVDESTHPGMAGTFLYMAPEQANGKPEKASDWYSFGVMLHEALTGQHPFRGTGHDMPWRRQDYAPPPPHDRCPGVPEDLSRLAVELLCPCPDNRPQGPEVCRRLARDDGALSPPILPIRSFSPDFLGRESHLAFLDEAFRDVQAGRGVTVLVNGPSGVGKSALVQHFLERLRQREEGLVVLAGRCYERESVPYKALDGMVEALSRFWRRLPREQQGELLPDLPEPLVRVFPILDRVEAVAAAPRHGQDSQDPYELRRRAFAGLRQVLFRIGRRWPLVVHLDDLQWGDVDSARMLTDLLLPPDPPRLLLLASFRSEDRQTGPFLRAFLSAETGSVQARDQRELSVDVLDDQEARELACRLLGDGQAPNAAPIAHITRESGGNPFFIHRLVEAVRAGEPEVTLERVIWSQVDALPEGQRRLLELVALASRPLSRAVVCQAAQLKDEGERALIDLCAIRLLRPSAGERQKVETWHDRIRETVIDHLPRETQIDHHRRLALALVGSGSKDYEVLATHFCGAREVERAGHYFDEAAGEATRALAFDRAAALYREALKSRSWPAEEACRLQRQLGEALAKAGRGAEAARVYLELVKDAEPGQTLELQRRAAEQFLRAGHIEEGVQVLRTVLRRVGIPYPATSRRALLSLFFRRPLIWWRGTRFRKRKGSEVSPEELLRVDVCWSAGVVLRMVDTVRGLSFHARHYLLALRAGEPGRVALALASEAVQQAVKGVSRQHRAEFLFRRARELAQSATSPDTQATIDLMEGESLVLLGQWKKAVESIEKAEVIFRKKSMGVAWELGVLCYYRFLALYALGEWKRCAEELPNLLREAQERGDRFTQTCLLIQLARNSVAVDEPDRARALLEQVARQWPYEGFHVQHYQALSGRVDAELYAGEVSKAWSMMSENWGALSRSMLLRVQCARVDMIYRRARCALAVAVGGDLPRGTGSEGMLRFAERDARQLERENLGWATAGARLIRAAVARLRGEPTETVVSLLDQAEKGFEAVEMHLRAAAARRCRGQLIGGEEGAQLVQKADVLMKSEGVCRPDRITNLLAPGFSEKR